MPIKSKVIGSRGLMWRVALVSGSNTYRHRPDNTGPELCGGWNTGPHTAWTYTRPSRGHRYTSCSHSLSTWHCCVRHPLTPSYTLKCTMMQHTVVYFLLFRLKQACNFFFDKIILYLVHHINQIMVCLSWSIRNFTFLSICLISSISAIGGLNSSAILDYSEPSHLSLYSMNIPCIQSNEAGAIKWVSNQICS